MAPVDSDEYVDTMPREIHCRKGGDDEKRWEEPISWAAAIFVILGLSAAIWVFIWSAIVIARVTWRALS